MSAQWWALVQRRDSGLCAVMGTFVEAGQWTVCSDGHFCRGGRDSGLCAVMGAFLEAGQWTVRSDWHLYRGGTVNCVQRGAGAETDCRAGQWCLCRSGRLPALRPCEKGYGIPLRFFLTCYGATRTLEDPESAVKFCC